MIDSSNVEADAPRVNPRIPPTSPIKLINPYRYVSRDIHTRIREISGSLDHKFKRLVFFMNSGDCFSLWIREIAFPYENLPQLDIEFRYICKSSYYLIQKVCSRRESNPGLWIKRWMLFWLSYWSFLKVRRNLRKFSTFWFTSKCIFVNGG